MPASVEDLGEISPNHPSDEACMPMKQLPRDLSSAHGHDEQHPGQPSIAEQSRSAFIQAHHGSGHNGPVPNRICVAPAIQTPFFFSAADLGTHAPQCKPGNCPVTQRLPNPARDPPGDHPVPSALPQRQQPDPVTSPESPPPHVSAISQPHQPNAARVPPEEPSAPSAAPQASAPDPTKLQVQDQPDLSTISRPQQPDPAHVSSGQPKLDVDSPQGQPFSSAQQQRQDKGRAGAASGSSGHQRLYRKLSKKRFLDRFSGTALSCVSSYGPHVAPQMQDCGHSCCHQDAYRYLGCPWRTSM